MPLKIDDKLVKTAMRTAKMKTKRATVEAALRLLADLSRQERTRELRGKVTWEGALEESRSMRAFLPL